MIRSTGTKAGGVPLAISLTVLDHATGKPIPGAAVYLWHCDREGRYSMYSPGVQAAGTDGKVTFESIFPAAYSGRWPHIHFEVYKTLAGATSAQNRLATSQVALLEATCKLVYATDGYSRRVTNLPRTSLATDMVFSDGTTNETPTVTGSVSDGYTIKLTAPITA